MRKNRKNILAYLDSDTLGLTAIPTYPISGLQIKNRKGCENRLSVL
jgi:hypothetical protein